jgi:TldD protein
MIATAANSPSDCDYFEIRIHELSKTNMVLIDGNLSTNSHSTSLGTCARVFDKGYWGFASAPNIDQSSATKVTNKAKANAKAMSRFGEKRALAMSTDAYKGEHFFRGKTPMTQKERIDLLHAMQAFCSNKYPDLKSSTFMMLDEHHTKTLATSTGSDSVSSIQRAVCYFVFTGEDDHGNPVRISNLISGKGTLADLDLSMPIMEQHFEKLHEHLLAKRRAIPAVGGQHTVVLAPELAGMLAHEAMGHPCEADIVLGGAVTGDLRGKQVASELITMVDFAHSYDGDELSIPVYVDDEGTPATDAVLIENGSLKQFMNSRETAARTDDMPTGNARAYQYDDEPLVRMRNTAILPGKNKIEEMIAGVEDGYDSTTEFMFGITLGYEIKNGELGSAIKDTTVSGNAINMLQSIDAVSDDMCWVSAGYCGKKQPMVVSMGGPALRGVVHLGGE